MAQFVVRNIDQRIKAKLQRRAKRNGHSMEEEVRDILRNTLNSEEDLPAGGLGTEISSLFVKRGLDFDIPELRGHEIKPVVFEK